LWTAYYLAQATDADIVVIDAEHVGFGASGRNGGWCSALFPASLESLSRLPGSSRSAALAQADALRATIDEIGRVVQAEGIDCGWAKGGTVIAARSAAQWARAQAEYEHALRWGRSDLRLLDGDEAAARINASKTVGATFTRDCAALHPGRLAHGLAAACERLGVEIFHQSRATAMAPGTVTTERGRLHADVVVRATEGYTATLPGHRRAIAPVYSLVTATAPLTADLWSEIGLAERETFADHRHVVVYGQRTADDRLVFGGRGAPYHLGSRIRPRFDHAPLVFDMLRRTLVEMFPVLSDIETTHTWGGVLGVPRDWCASVGFDRTTGLGWAGGYVGDGVSTTNLAGRTLRDLVLGAETDLTALPWVGHRSPRWEPEPVRWLGINAGLRAMMLADAEERATGRPSRIARLVKPLVS
jgi:glycine/D-amino acid oxidase-like deaminating enzyme